MSAALVASALQKRYGSLDAVRGLDLSVDAGVIFGLIGPDGAGKTSTFHMLAGIMRPTSGEVRLFGRPAHEARPHIGYLTQAFSLYPDLSVWENIRYVGEMRGMAPADMRKRAMDYLTRFGMERFLSRLAGQLSGGMKQKLALACALITRPRLLLLDEPTTGVDPVSRREFWDVLAHLSRDGLTIVVATPYLDEAERCHRVALMHEGRVDPPATPEELRRGTGTRRLEVYVADLRQAEERLAQQPGLGDVQRFGDRLDVMVDDADEGKRRVRELLLPAIVTDLRVADPTLENVFVSSIRARGAGRVIVDVVTPRADGPLRSEVAIETARLGKRFGSFVAVQGVDLSIRGGEIYGLLGANGAGKTTTIKMLCGLLDPSEGEVSLVGARGAEMRRPEVRARVGYMSQRFSLYDDLTIKQNLAFFASIYGIAPAERAERIQRVLRFADLDGRGDTLTAALPGGWKQRVAFGAAVMHEPHVVFLDEPTSGVDPIARRALWREINRLKDDGVAVLVTTHYLEEAEQCNRLGFMVGGALAVQGSPSALKAAQTGVLLSCRTSDPQTAADTLRLHLERWRVSLFGDRLHVVFDHEAAVDTLRGLLAPSGVQVLQAEPTPFSLEDIFIALVERGSEARA